MAIDLIVSPLSKYWSGDYITPIMEYAWSVGADYKVAEPNGVRTLERGSLYGGASAKNDRVKWIAFVANLLERFPEWEKSECWDEESEYFGFHRVNPDCFSEVLKLADKQFSQNTNVMRRLMGHKKKLSHLARGIIFLPIDFEGCVRVEGKMFASVFRAREELLELSVLISNSECFEEIVRTYDDAIEQGLPLVVDS